MLKNFDLSQTLECGQCFRWDRQEDGSYCGVVRGRVLHISTGNMMEAKQDPFWRDYFDLERDYPEICKALAKDSQALATAAEFASGIRILNQEPWEALCCFIISQNNNIPRIKGIVSRLCTAFGTPIEEGMCAFPTAQRIQIATEEELRALGTGFRARYLLDAAQKISSGEVDLEELRTLPLAQAREKLMCITGVGPKVADCTLLYGLHRLDAFPADVWIKRAMVEYFPGKTAEDFGEYAGIAQQYIFHYIRCTTEKSKNSSAQKIRAV